MRKANTNRTMAARRLLSRPEPSHARHAPGHILAKIGGIAVIAAAAATLAADRDHADADIAWKQPDRAVDRVLGRHADGRLDGATDPRADGVVAAY
ncbi:MAG: hypothetical protein FJX35_25360 [Alphaproteobacteria bacterium]|nr:hypothetical protein [Alphaproteobacteria bacterium]